MSLGSTAIDGGYWAERRAVNLERAILYQWERCEESGAVDNFRIAAGLKEGRRRGFFYADSDLHKWADAAARTLRSARSARGATSDASSRLEALLAEYVGLVTRAQEPDGYLFTYNQICFPGTRWKNLMIEHELYCLGHFIEAGVSLYEAEGRHDLLESAERAAALVAKEFRGGTSDRTSGHEEIEIALLRLYRITRKAAYLETARALLERRGRIRFFGFKFLAQLASQAFRSRKAAAPPAPGEAAPASGFELGGNMGRLEPPLIALRSLPVFLGGSYQQQDRPLRERPGPRGHAVRWAYLMTATAMLYAESGDESLLRAMGAAWGELVGSKMYLTGGLGSLPLIEGFGAPYELDNRYAYAETCAAIGSMLWNRELSLAVGGPAAPSGEARFADLYEWQLYNAASVGISRGGDRYFYRNPLASDGEIARRPWFPTPCCPSNLSRLWADLDRQAFSLAEGALRVEQYFGASALLGEGSAICVESAFPWSGEVSIRVEAAAPMRLFLRMPGWSSRCVLRVDGGRERRIERAPAEVFGEARFSSSSYEELSLEAGTSLVELDFSMPVLALRAHPKARCDRGRAAIVRGPLVYCAEALDNLGLDLDTIVADPAAFEPAPFPSLGEGCVALTGPARLVPYFLWGNRGSGGMRVFLRVAGAQ
jgi:uncharacterized protein